MSKLRRIALAGAALDPNPNPVALQVLTEANMELATKLQLLEEAMVGADTIMERRTEMMRALAEENEDLLAMVETAESQGQGGVPQHDVSFAPTDSMSQIPADTPISEVRYSPTQAAQATPGEPQQAYLG